MKLKRIEYPESNSEVLYNRICRYIRLYKNQNGQPYIVFDYDNRKTICFLSERNRIEDMFRKICLNAADKIISKGNAEDIYKTVAMQANETNQVIVTLNRIYTSNICFAYNLGNGNVVAISNGGYKILNIDDLKKFNTLESTDFMPQVIPCFDNSETLTDLLGKIVNLKGDDLFLFAVYIVSLFFSNISHPMLILNGQHGACKSTAMRIVCNIINPDIKSLQAMPEKKDDLINALYNSYFVAFDNVSTIKNDISDILCKAVTGSSISKRKLYTDCEEITLDIKRAIAINGISIDITQSDLLDRSIMLNFQRLNGSSRKTDNELDNQFKILLPKILGEIFKLIHNVFKIKNDVTVNNLPRMADFAYIGYCIAESIECGGGERFLDIYKNNNQSAIEQSLQYSSLITSLIDFMADKDDWCGNATELYRSLIEQFYNVPIPKDFPSSSNHLSRAINKYKLDLAKLGIDIEIGRSSQRFINIIRR